MSRSGWAAVRSGASLALAVLLAILIMVEVVDATIGIGRGSNWVFAFYAVALGAMVAGGRLAAQQRPQAPLTAAAAAAVAAYAVAAALGTVTRLLAGKEAEPVALAFNALMAASAGILGGLLAGRPASSTS